MDRRAAPSGADGSTSGAGRRRRGFLALAVAGAAALAACGRKADLVPPAKAGAKDEGAGG